MRGWVVTAASALALGVGLGACPGETEIAKDPATAGGASGGDSDDPAGAGGSGSGGRTETAAGRGGSSGSGSGSGGASVQRGGTGGNGASGAGGSGAGEGGAGKGGNGSAGTSGSGGGGAVLDKCIVSGCSNTICADVVEGPQITTCEWRDEYACYQNATCERQGNGDCAWTQTDALKACLGGGVGTLQWFESCGAPVCTADLEPFDDASIPNCTTEKVSDACSESGARCDGVATCGATLICATSDPQSGAGGCPRSRARFKQDIHYLDGDALAQYHEQVVHMPLASYRYKQSAADSEASEQLGFIIDDIEPSAAASGDRVNLYGYLSMAVAAIKVQQRQIDTLERKLEQLEATRAGSDSAAVCAP
jgi:hypothetical protein